MTDVNTADRRGFQLAYSIGDYIYRPPLHFTSSLSLQRRSSHYPHIADVVMHVLRVQYLGVFRVLHGSMSMGELDFIRKHK